jgi:hypothetical protein
MYATPRGYNVHKFVYEFLNTAIFRYCKQGVKKELSFIYIYRPVL